MTLKLYFHPLASFSHKALIALYEHDIAFEREILGNLFDPEQRAAFQKVWPLAKFPVLRDEARGRTVGESTAVIAYLDAFYAKGAPLLPADKDLQWQALMWDQFCDNYLQVPMQTIVGDTFRPEGSRDPYGCDAARARLLESYAILENAIQGPWLLGDSFTLADVAAAPALFFGDVQAPVPASLTKVNTYLERLMARPSYARTLEEAEPFFQMVPTGQKPSLTRARR